MINTLKLKAKLKEKNMTQEELATKIGINASTLNQKINNTIGETLTIEEATKMSEILDISREERMDIFFVDLLEKTQELI
jgi:hypothetical protein